jgi:Dynamin family
MTADYDVRRLLAEIAEAARQADDPATVREARAEADGVAAHAATVIVAGESKRGKSSLINALLRRPELLPVDADITSSVHVVVHAADTEAASAVDDVHPAGLGIPLADIAEYAALDSQTLLPRHPEVRQVTVGLPDDLLACGVALIDTPGVGGLVSGHASLTLTTLPEADALLFVVNGESELTRSEWEFLTVAAESSATVVFVLTQTDKYPSWETVLAANRRLIAEHAPALSGAPWFSVSSAMRLDAVEWAAIGRPEAALAEEQSGFGPLAAALVLDIAGRSARLRAIEAALVARALVDKLTADAEQRGRSLARDPGHLPMLVEEQQRLESLLKGGMWQRELNERFRALRSDLMPIYRERYRALRAWTEQDALADPTATRPEIERQFNDRAVEMWNVLVGAAHRSAVRIAEDIAGEFRANGVDLRIDGADARPAPDLAYPELFSDGTTGPERRAAPRRRLSERLLKAWPGMSGLSMTAMATHTVFFWLTVPSFVVLPVGVLVAAGLMKAHRDRDQSSAARDALRVYVTERLRLIADEMQPQLSRGLDSVRDEVGKVITEAIDRRLEELASAVTTAVSDQRAPEASLAPQRASEEALRNWLVTLRERAELLAAGETAVAGAS